MAELVKIEFIELPAARMIGKEVIFEKDNNPVPELWKSCFQSGAFQSLDKYTPVIDYYIGWMGEFDNKMECFTYIAGYLMPASTPVPDGFQYRDLQACKVGMGYIHGSFENVFSSLHELTIDGIKTNNYAPDYSQGWSAEVYAKDLNYESSEGTVNYICPCMSNENTYDNLEDAINYYHNGMLKEVAMNFLNYLNKSDLTPKNTYEPGGWKVPFKDKYLCGIWCRENHFDVHFWYSDFNNDIDKDTALVIQNRVACCFTCHDGCTGGINTTVFGNNIENVCSQHTIQFNNPDEPDLPHMINLLEYCKKHIPSDVSYHANNL